MDFIKIIFAIVVGIVFGMVTKSMSENKGYDGGFWWGFFLGIIGVIIVACKPDNRSGARVLSNSEREEEILNRGGWKCMECGRLNSSYIETCVCGCTVSENRKMEKEAEEEKERVKAELMKQKKLFDDGIITEEEYNEIKKNLLKL